MNSDNNMTANETSIRLVIETVGQATGIPSWQTISQSRKRELCQARSIIAHHLRHSLHLTLKQIAGILNKKSHVSIMHLLVQYDLDYQYTPGFCTLADSITDRLINSIEQQATPCTTQ